MLLNRDNLKLHRIWFVLFALGTVGSLAGLCFSRDGRLFPGGSSLIGIVLGMIAGSIIVFEFLLWPRKKFFRRWRMGRVRTWMCAHIWLGLLTVPMAIIHAGIPWGGTLASATMILLFVVVASGIFGLALQQFLPRMLVDSVREETIFSQIENVLQQYLAEADALVWTTCGGKDEADTAFWSKMYPADFRDDGHTARQRWGKAFDCQCQGHSTRNRITDCSRPKNRNIERGLPRHGSWLSAKRNGSRYWTEPGRQIADVFSGSSCSDPP